ncbi:MAG: hypothetical protein HXX08_08075 [Chloroflexi bacterium]|uniref:Uncharacterized protein n=1 Tax=Candidatus Chlorohelix allophototropha TaxID=3003348 RepID=A0A8T7M1B4_9CHLR|nr:hypothetical protein [Chloroflexota bacterium]WJW67684.1 hypothetical protein OZ401_000959 [Chloroflexota bacterium L227-S17]
MSVEITEKEQNPADAPQVPTNPYYYQPAYQYPTNYWQQYQSMRTSSIRTVNILFWVFYALVGFWVDFSIAVSLWTVALILPFTLPIALVLRTFNNQDYSIYINGVYYNNLTDAQYYTAAGIITAIGIMILIGAVMTIKPMLKLHRILFRDLGGLKI